MNITKRSFLKLLGITVPAATVTAAGATLVRVPAKPLPDEVKFSLRVLVTDQVLIHYGDGTVDLNCYGTQIKLIGQAHTCEYPIKWLNFESQPLTFEMLNKEKWDSFDLQCYEYCKKHLLTDGSKDGFGKIVTIKV